MSGAVSNLCPSARLRTKLGSVEPHDMREARYHRNARVEYDALSGADQADVDGLVRHLEDDPRPDGIRKKAMNPHDEFMHLIVYFDGRWRIVYHASLDGGLIIYGCTKIGADWRAPYQAGFASSSSIACRSDRSMRRRSPTCSWKQRRQMQRPSRGVAIASSSSVGYL